MTEPPQSPLQEACDFLNDIIADSGVVARPSKTQIVWFEQRVGPDGEVEEYPTKRKRAYRAINAAGQNPLKLMQYVCETYDITYTWK